MIVDDGEGGAITNDRGHVNMPPPLVNAPRHVKVVVSHTHEFHPKLKTRNRQLSRYMKLIFSESP